MSTDARQVSSVNNNQVLHPANELVMQGLCLPHDAVGAVSFGHPQTGVQTFPLQVDHHLCQTTLIHIDAFALGDHIFCQLSGFSNQCFGVKRLNQHIESLTFLSSAAARLALVVLARCFQVGATVATTSSATLIGQLKCNNLPLELKPFALVMRGKPVTLHKPLGLDARCRNRLCETIALEEECGELWSGPYFQRLVGDIDAVVNP